ncbi:DNA-directed RNA polymerase subunit K [Candidatus Woesearchaeota archaeon]|jgi:DNA-directed RNA polymerase subunit K|nr:DNA-directed RNA polymerase subunit K [Candidatus Woesearchaeota archaeon]MDP6648333.1 DNA-directed RNA polymerase subunit K [Candidatus Woesearchaeota archaeon]|tara:strand:+ start:1833 stop:2081 length:249 start_codon:yes stop_codon:yes gene_type:complete
MKEYTKYEQARIIGARALQISMGAPFMIKLTEEELHNIGFNTVEIAKREFEQGVIPIAIKKPMPGTNRKDSSVKAFDQTKLE